MYQPHQLDLSHAQLVKLARSQAVRVKGDGLGVGETYHLSKSQMAKYTRAKKTGRGFTLSMDGPPVAHHMRVGTGRFGDFLRGVGQKLKGAAASGASYLGGKAIDAVSDIASNKIQDLVGKIGLPQGVTDYANSGVSDGVKYGSTATKAGLAHFLSGLAGTRSGSGLFDFLGPQVGGILNALGNGAVSVGTNIIAKKLGGGLKRSKRHTHMHEQGRLYGESRSPEELAHFIQGVGQTRVGRGLFDFLGPDVGGVLNTLGNGALDVGTSIAGTVIKKKLGLGVGMHACHTCNGSGLYP